MIYNSESGKAPVPTLREPRISTYLNAVGVKRGLPVSGTFELTARCNFDCRMCYVHLNNASELLPRELTAAQWLDLACQARDRGMMFLLLTGGEPFLRADFPYLYTELIRMGFMVSVNTNASLYNEELRALFNKYPPSRINATLYGGSEETYRSLCGNASFGRVYENLRSMKEDGLPVRLNVTLTPYNAGDIERIDAISRELQLQTKTATYMYPPFRVDGSVGENTARFTPEEAGLIAARWAALRDEPERFIARADRVRASLDAGLTETCADVEQEGISCRAGRSAFWITWDGRMLPCGTMNIEASYPLEVGFAQAWDEVRARTAAIRMPAGCAGCPKRGNCGVCASICMGETGRFDEVPTYMCRMTDSLCRSIVRIGGELREAIKNQPSADSGREDRNEPDQGGSRNEDQI